MNSLSPCWWISLAAVLGFVCDSDKKDYKRRNAKIENTSIQPKQADILQSTSSVFANDDNETLARASIGSKRYYINSHDWCIINNHALSKYQTRMNFIPS